MKKTLWGLLILIIILVIVTISVWAVPILKERGINNAIKKANYCNVKDDCVDLGAVCPFGCNIFVNVDEVEKIRGMLNSYHSKCVYSCVAMEDYDCIAGKCVPEFKKADNLDLGNHSLDGGINE